VLAHKPPELFPFLLRRVWHIQSQFPRPGQRGPWR
jgi:hypothetical protein